MSRPSVIGVDPGPIPGIVVLDPVTRPEVVQCSAGVAVALVDALVDHAPGTVLLAVEAFVVGPRAARSSSAGAGTATRDLLGALAQLADDRAVALRRYRAADVMPWATDRRLAAAGLVEPTKGMRHARAAARHALYCAVRDGGYPDPLAPRTAGSPPAGAVPDRSPHRKARP